MKCRLWDKPKRWFCFGIPLGGYLAAVFGVLLWGGFSTALELTNTESFCISCHEMRDTVYQEYRNSPHFKTTSGVIASCPDCHVPKPLLPKLLAKVKASADVYHTLVGSIDTPEKFNARRQLMAERVWAIMKATDSRECRNRKASRLIGSTSPNAWHPVARPVLIAIRGSLMSCRIKRCPVSCLIRL